MKQIVIVEDDVSLSRGLCLALKDSGHLLVQCFDIISARAQLMCSKADLLLLDVNLPDGNGIDFLFEVKSKGLSKAVIMMTANDTDSDIVCGLESGADDYITKPFSLAVLRARVNARLRSNEVREKDTVIIIDSLRLDFEDMEFYSGEKELLLSKTEQKLLKYLIENRGMTLSRAVLLERIWGDGVEYVDENALSVTVKRLRDKLGADEYVKTVYGIGYTWVVTHNE